MKVFSYNVGSYEWRDSVAWGDAWRAAKTKATELHKPIYRCVMKNADDMVGSWEVFCGDCFLRVDLAKKAEIEPMVF